MIRHKTLSIARRRLIHSSVDRVTDTCDVLIVGAGPSGLSAAIRLKQLAQQADNRDLRVVVLEKGSEVGSHILSGCVLQPTALHTLLGPDISSYDSLYSCGPPPLGQPAGKSEMRWLTKSGKAISIPHPPQMNNEGNHIISLSAFTRWLARVAEEHYGVEVYPGFAGAGVMFGEEEVVQNPWEGWEGKWAKGVTGLKVKSKSSSTSRVQSVLGITTNDVGISKSGQPKSSFEPGMEFRAKATLLAEGAHGSLTKTIIKKYGLRNESDPQTYGFGLKEVWRVAEDNPHYSPGTITHTLGFPLDLNTYGGGWIYHMDQGLISIGLVLGADWENPYRNPYKDFQSMKHHPYLRKLLSPSNSSSTRLAYGARTLTEGGLQSLPLLHFPGGALIGDTAGTVNVAKIKGVHTAMGTGILGAEATWRAISNTTNDEEPANLSAYSQSFLTSSIYAELHEIRNLRPSFSLPPFTNLGMGVLGGVLYSGIDSLILKGRTPWTLRHTKTEVERFKSINSSPSLDSTHTKPSSQFKEISYPTFEPPLSTDLMTSVMLTGTSHEEDQPEHLRVLTMDEASVVTETDSSTSDTFFNQTSTSQSNNLRPESERRREHVRVNVGEYAGLLARACPAGVYEYVDDESSKDGNTQGNGWQGKKLVINAQNCIHCKLCDIKVPTQDITWTVPEGGGGPKYKAKRLRVDPRGTQVEPTWAPITTIGLPWSLVGSGKVRWRWCIAS